MDRGNIGQVGRKKKIPNQRGSCRKIEELGKEELNKRRRGSGKVKGKRNVGEVMGVGNELRWRQQSEEDLVSTRR